MREVCIPLVIPAYEPDERFLGLLQSLKESGTGPVIVVNDGSGGKYRNIFEAAEQMMASEDFKILNHRENRGKGCALKTAFSYVYINYQHAIGVVTADSDGQHTCACIRKVREALAEHPKSLVLGSRDFDLEGIPWKSRFGNKLTEKVLAYVAGLKIHDTQTGLRGIPKEFMKELIDLESDRFEFEMQMILETIGKREIVEVPVSTVYDSQKGHLTHFRPVVDSVKIYKILCGRFYRYLFSALSSSLLDLLIFRFSCLFFKNSFQWYIAVSTGIARVISASYNYMLNNEFVFRSRERKKVSLPKYVMLAAVQMACSAVLVTGIAAIFPVLPELFIKIVVDTGLFFLSYKIQQKYIF